MHGAGQKERGRGHGGEATGEMGSRAHVTFDAPSRRTIFSTLQNFYTNTTAPISH